MKCEVCRDLLPMYIDGLTSEVTNQEIELHMDQCEKCREVYENMSSAIEDELKAELQIPKKEEIDYLKKFRKKGKQYVVSGGLFLTTVIIVLMLCGIPVPVSSKDIAFTTYEQDGEIMIDGKWVGNAWSGLCDMDILNNRLYEGGEFVGDEDVYVMKKTLLRGDFFGESYNGTDDGLVVRTWGTKQNVKKSYRVRFVFSDKDIVFENGKRINNQ